MQDEFAALHACKNGTERVVLCTLWLRSAIAAAGQDGVLYAYGFTKLDSAINDMTALFQSGCRLCFVPMPFPYAQVLKHMRPIMSAVPTQLLLTVASLCVASVSTGRQVCHCPLPRYDTFRYRRHPRLADSGGHFHLIAPLFGRR